MVGDVIVNITGERGKPTAFYLEIIPHGESILRIPLRMETLLVGRSTNRCQIVLDDSRVSRVHLRIARDLDRGVTVADLHSANGTIFEGHRLRPGEVITWLLDQEVIIGRTRLILRYGQAEGSES
jgi:pSer/pThr/pTyr-binding forkhead associated (FHA) protein